MGRATDFLSRVPSRDHQHDPLKPWQAHMVAMTGEFAGTFMFLFFAFAGTQSANLTTVGRESETSQIFFVSAAFGLSLLSSVWMFFRISGGLFNPAVTVAMIISKTLPLTRGLLLLPVQFIAAMVASGLVSCMFPADIALVKTKLGAGTSITQGLFIEMFLTCQLIFAVLMLAAEKSKDTYIAPIGIGLAFFAAELAGVSFTGGSLNPARSFGPCVASRSFESYHWIYWIGPLLGSLLTAAYYRFVKYFNYEEANPGQDSAV